MLAMGEPAERRALRLGWSRWRRAHQAVAARCRAPTHALAPAPAPAPRAVTLPAPPPTGLSDAEWALVRPLLPPRKSRVGRPPHDHRTVLSGILAVVRGDGSWRAMPPEYGKWERAYKRYRRWRASGLWQRILTALSEGGDQAGG